MSRPLIIRKIGLITLIGLIGLTLPWPAEGQTVSLSIWPPLLSVMVKPGKSITQVYRVKNSADDTKIKVSVVPFTAADEQGHINLQFDQAAPPFFSILNADLPDLPLELNLKAGETQELVLKISVPAQAEELDYPVAFVVESDTQGLIGGSGSQARATIASPVLLTVSQSGQPSQIAQIAEFSTVKIIDSFDPIEFVVRVKNQSFHVLRPVGQIEVKNTFGRKVASLALESDNILAGTIRQLRPKIETEASGASVNDKIVWNPVLPLGRYTASVALTPEDTTNTVSAQIYFWALPYKAMLTAAILIFGWRAFKRSRKSAILK